MTKRTCKVFHLKIVMLVFIWRRVFKSHTPLQLLQKPHSCKAGAAFAFLPANRDKTSNLPPLSAFLPPFVSFLTHAGAGI